LVNARIAYTSNDSSWQVALWGKNLSDEEYARAGTAGSFTQRVVLKMNYDINGPWVIQTQGPDFNIEARH